MNDAPEWMESKEAVRAEIERRIVFVLQLMIDVEAAINDELIIQGII